MKTTLTKMMTPLSKIRVRFHLLDLILLALMSVVVSWYVWRRFKDSPSIEFFLLGVIGLSQVVIMMLYIKLQFSRGIWK